jgi:hypothetical protein
VLFLDTCEFINIVQSPLPKRRPDYLETAADMLEALNDDPDLMQIVVSELVHIEWKQNAIEKENELIGYLESLDQQIANVRNAWLHLQVPLAFTHPAYRDPALAAHVMALVNDLLGMAEVIDFDDACKNRAFTRVIRKQRPAREGKVKDAVIVEHYLELSKQLKAGGFQYRRAFVTSNSDDFSLNKVQTSQLHSDLGTDFANCGMEFFVDLRAAYEQLSRDPILPSTP